MPLRHLRTADRLNRTWCRYRARYLDTAAGRWISEDPIGFAGGDANVVRYVANAPTVYTDPSGLKSPELRPPWRDLVKGLPAEDIQNAKETARELQEAKVMHNKSDAISDLLYRLRLSERGWRVVDHWEADQCSVGIASSRCPNKLVYVSTFKKAPGKYYYECERLFGRDDAEVSYDTVAEGDDVSFEELLFLMKKHIDPIDPD